MAFLLFSVIVFITVTVLSPKRLPRNERYAIALFSIVLAFVIDLPLDLKYHLYGYFTPGIQLAGFLPALILFPTSGILYLNFFPYKKSKRYQLFYIFCWTIFCMVYEFFSVKSGYFYHNGWKYWHSAVTYPILLLLHLLHLRFYRRYINK